MSFTKYLENPEIYARYNKVKPYFKLRSSAYDLTTRCQLKCEGCYFFSGESSHVEDSTDVKKWRHFFITEQERGINYFNLAGAEPALVPDLLFAAWNVLPFGTIFTNGLKLIDREINYRIHISVWGDEKGDKEYRGVNCLPKQLKNYQDDNRAVFVYTINKNNIDQLPSVAHRIVSSGHRMTFNFFSNPVGEHSPLQLDECSRKRAYDTVVSLIEQYGSSILFSRYSAEVHTASESLYKQFDCPCPRVADNGKKGLGIGQRYRSYRADHTHHSSSDCCAPNTECFDCRLYAAGSLIVPSRMDLHVSSEDLFRGWLDYLDVCLCLYLNDYERDIELYR
ncbi:radical SAM protein [Reinekea marinisedimentorum]|uniref:MoaA/NifB/PqqE/SkfB family radical SAM enzyme n=1 Tax=Reinekea marinisedimentorum TaxID=230495 RepID=A0A4R3I990_9GAMM|nr:radical SAM protein [Reinekea marinisedimentorum]TCS41942.1 MoaA/NifB/PqqE/SkfB family radical SAM enzyme [Reinekea marinisedimentorum]